MKALWIADRLPPDRGGVAVAAERQLRALAPKLERLDVLRLAADLPPGRAEAVDRGGWTLYRVGRAREGDESLQLLAQTAANLLGARGHDLVHGFGAVHAGYVAVMAARQATVPSAVSLPGNDLASTPSQRRPSARGNGAAPSSTRRSDRARRGAVIGAAAV
jgi:hypothetical protein